MTDEYINYTLTTAGRALIARIIGGLEMTFKRISIGDGFDYNVGSFADRTEMVNEVKSLTNLTMKITSSNVVELTTKFSKGDIESSFWFREIGVFVVDPDDADNEILFAYGNKNDSAEYITPHVDNYAVQKEINLLLSCGVSSNVHINISDEQVASRVEFLTADWTLDSASGLYTLELGAIKESVRVFKTTPNGLEQVMFVEITRDSSNLTTLKAMTAFDGCVVCI